jgi:uncharacterized protein (DUF305 family)
MIVHHQDAVTMPQTELAQGSNPATRNFAQQIISAQQADNDSDGRYSSAPSPT